MAFRNLPPGIPPDWEARGIFPTWEKLTPPDIDIRNGVFKADYYPSREPWDWAAWDAQESVPLSTHVGKGGDVWSKVRVLFKNTRSGFARLPNWKKTAIVAGVGIAGFTGYNLFSGRDDAYNTIEGMPELGLTAEQRHILTDFGSGWRGAIVSGAVSMGKEFGSNLKDYKGTAAVAGAVGLYYGWEKGKKEGKIHWGQFAGLLAADMADDVLLLGSILAARRFPALAKLKPYLEHPIVKRAGIGLFGFTIGKLTGEIAGSAFSDIPKENAGYNPINGMHPGNKGMATSIIRDNTPFGSKYDRVKALAEMAGMSFEKFIETPTFLKALSGSKIIKTLGEGGFGKATLREANIGGETLQFVEKTSKKYPDSAVSKAIKATLGTEAETLKLLGQTEAAPTFYGYSQTNRLKEVFGGQNKLWMEYIPGSTAAEVASSTGERLALSPEGERMMRSTMESAAGKGIRHADPHGGNVIYHPETKEAFLIDWGLTQKTGPLNWKKEAEESFSELMRQSEFASKTPVWRKRRNEARWLESPLPHLEGMPSHGMAHAGRPEPFKSPGGWLTRAFGSMFPKKAAREVVSLMGEGAGKLLSPQRAAEMAKGQTLETFAERLRGELGESVDIWTFRGQEGRAQFREVAAQFKETHGIKIEGGAFSAEVAGKRTIVMDVETMKESFRGLAAQRDIMGKSTEKALASEDFLNTTLYHEVLEGQSRSLFSLKTMPKGAGHASSQVILGEGGFIGAIGNRHVEKLFWKVRKGTTYAGAAWEGQAFEAGYTAFKGGRAAKNLSPVTAAFEASPAKETLLASSVELRTAQEQLSRAAVAGGKGHLHPTGKHVTQLDSRHGGGL